MPVRAIRGAVDVAANTRDAICEATQRLLTAVCEVNGCGQQAIISVFFTQTVDLDADYPAAAARAMGWTEIPLLDAQELDIVGGMPRVIRVLVHVDLDMPRSDVRHVYLGATANLRPDLAAGPRA